MVYDPKTWATGELITAEDLNRLEQAVDATDAALDGKVDDTDPRLTDASTPTDHQHVVADVTGLAARLAALEYDSGIRDVSGTLLNGWAGVVTLSRAGKVVTVHFETIDSASSTSVITINLPPGFRPAYRPGDRVFRNALIATGAPTEVYQVDIDRYGNLRVFVPTTVGAKTLRGSVVFSTPDPVPTTLPGTPA